MKIKEFLNELNLLGNVYTSGRGFVPEPKKENEENIKVIFNCKTEEYCDYDQCVSNSKKKINVDKIIIKYTDNTWYGDPIEWYNDDEYLKKIENENFIPIYKKHYKKYKLLDKINSKNYISIVDPFMEIHLDRNIKGEDLTFEDILFATRGLCVDHTRTINSYKKLKKTNNTLILEPDIDNYST
jgi:hypothetical protein